MLMCLYTCTMDGTKKNTLISIVVHKINGKYWPSYVQWRNLLLLTP